MNNMLLTSYGYDTFLLMCAVSGVAVSRRTVTPNRYMIKVGPRLL